MATLLLGQIVWAASQAAVLLATAHTSSYEIIGSFSVGLSIFAPLCLLTGLNLRVAMAVSDPPKISPSTALLLRSTTTLACFILAGAITYLVSASSETGRSAILLLALRSFDQISDVSVGYFQQRNQRSNVGRSFLVRGLGNLAPFLVAFELGFSLDGALVISLLSTVLVVAYFDILPVTRTSVRSVGHNRNCIRSLIRSTWSISALHPVLDSLQANMLRYLCLMAASTHFMGVLALAQMMFVPFQLIVTATGYITLENSRKARQAGDKSGLKRYLFRSASFGLVASVLTALTIQSLPSQILDLVFHAEPDAVRESILMVGLAILFWASCGYLSQGLIVSDQHTRYFLAPLIGIGSSVLFFAVAREAPIDFSLWMIGACVCAGYLVRLIFSVLSVLHLHR
ncbi:hypothetical protein GQF56_21700 [Rhodobacter sphaeroides]|uniref:Capsular polysaccharide biosynthesis protein, putative n=1 Tax=Cereibacter sphaeroides (strain ATCC 17023 / DSM 158 / JCM 6121 / CCUG 31486 / LMG 2827 / NBRC 12203 / NCIMB 8253 / ATH 2.4.1.) TaxID=272943 RepID=Q3IV65_CERS4|nr:Capsular polysaccharide biosynthesis protein, putative [Cereibacter sphaeroides 2.4.1]AXC63996.1 hypothetical protein DQL45_21640 [Cereibacter sphaeroides 2.4.1]MVX50438.1 hypothetical protein [Cereibacter sphaeroides]QHA12223.1 hypothetical protein GQR99_21730 [Cereibacter sphaeroides]QHA15495.1 hypothetical protein GQY06_21660 [Cereibacter sphaeroides]